MTAPATQPAAAPPPAAGAPTSTPAAPGAATGETKTLLDVARFDEQAFLMYNIRKLALIHKDKHSGWGSYKKLDLLKGPNVALINKILNSDFFQKEAVLKLTPAQISELVPQIRIFKQYLNDELDVIRETELKFSAYTDPSDVLSDIGRSGYGIQSFDIESQGTTFYTADKQFTAKLVLYFQSFDHFVAQRGGYSFLDLLLQPPSGGSGANTKFRIRADLGWSIGAVTSTSAFAGDRSISSAIERSKVSFTLYPTTNDININDDGTLTVTMNYIAAFDVIGRDLRSGIILTKDQRATLDAISAKIENAAKANDTVTAESSRKELVNTQTSLNKDAMESIKKELMEPEDGKGKLFQVAISREAMDQFAKLGGSTAPADGAAPTEGAPASGGAPSPVSAPPTAPAAPAAPATPAAPGAPATPAAPGAPAAAGSPVVHPPIDFCSLEWAPQDIEDSGVNYVAFNPIQSSVETLTIEEFKTNPILKSTDGSEYSVITWFYLGDLFEIAMNRAYNPNSSGNSARVFGPNFSNRVKLLMTDIELIDYCTGQPIRLNLAHVPVSAKKFDTFFYNKVITTNNVNYTMDDLVRDVLKDLVSDIFLDRSYIANRNLKQNVNLKYYNLAVYGTGGDPLNPAGDVVSTQSMNAGGAVRANSIGRSANSYFFYMMIYQDTFDPAKLVGDYATDRSMGIAHIYMGRDRGITKKVSFKKSVIPYDREARIRGVGRGYDPITQLASLYNVDMETYGTTLFLAGTYFYLIPTGMGPSIGLPNQAGSIANIMGLGGYYFCNKITWSVATGKYTTNILAFHQATGGGGPVNNSLTARGNGAGITD